MERPPSSSGSPVIAAQGLTKVFSDFWLRSQVRAVDNLDLVIEPGQVFGLIGPNGSGKSTTIKLILGLLNKTSGRLVVFGKSPHDTQVKTRIGYLPEESYLYAYLNPRETLDFYGKLFGYPASVRKRRIDELLDMVGLDAVQYRPVGQFSKGMQRRIGIAQALINDPEFLILDEPTSGLDPIGIRQVKDLVIDLGRRGKTILLSSHLLSDVEDVCDRMVILYGGKKRAEGSRQELLTAHDRTMIETTALDEREASGLREYLRQHGGHEVLKIAPARQSLESLFMSIVDAARAEHATTSGAGVGGPTAAFLRGEGTDRVWTGDEVIADLLSEAGDETIAATTESEDARRRRPTGGDEPDESVLDSLIDQGGAEESEEAVEAGRQSRSESVSAGRSEDVDRSVLESLLGEGQGEDHDDRKDGGRE